MAVVNAETGRNRRLADALLTRSDIGVTELREKLLLAEQLQQQGKLAEAVQEYVAIGQFYTLRNQPMKAVQVLRQAARLQPDQIDVQIALGEGLAALKLVEDAATAFSRAVTLLHAQQRTAEVLDVVQRLVDLDPADLHGRLRLAEAMSRAGKTAEAAHNFQELAEALLSAGETEDWERVCERLLHHDPNNATVAHDLALHYVRSGRHAVALPKLILCYEVEASDAELLELIMDTLESLGQVEKAAAICRQLLAAYRRNGLAQEADRTLERLHGLDPDDVEAREHIGFLSSEVDSGTVLEFDSGPIAAVRRGETGPQRHQASAGFGVAAATRPAGPSGAHAAVAPALAARPMPVQPEPAAEDPEQEFGGPTATLVQAPSLAHAISPPVPRAAGQVTGRPASAAVAARPAPLPVPALRPAAVPAAVNPLPRPAQSETAARHPSVAAVGHTGRPAAVPALDALAEAGGDDGAQDWPNEDETGFESEDRTITEHLAESVLAAKEQRPSPQLHWHSASSSQNPAPAPIFERAPIFDGQPDPANAPSSQQPVLAARARSNSLPRPRLARRVGTVSDLPSTVRDLSKDLGTLDFFIERGFHDSAVALLDELQRRHPDSLQLRAYRQRVDRMPRG